ncbi:hypothetical protein KA005_50770 [bacterium]|nr:hypothetical protein [bacterium]
MEIKDRELLSRLSLEVVNEIAPDEIDLFDDFKEAFFNNPNAFLEKDPKKKEQMLGFALPAATDQFITTVVLPIVWNIIKKYISGKVNELRDGDKIKDLRDEIFTEAVSSGIDSDKANQIAESLSKKITTA